MPSNPPGSNSKGNGDYAPVGLPTPPTRVTNKPMGDVRAKDLDIPSSPQEARTVLQRSTGRKNSRKGGRSGGR